MLKTAVRPKFDQAGEMGKIPGVYLIFFLPKMAPSEPGRRIASYHDGAASQNVSCGDGVPGRSNLPTGI